MATASLNDIVRHCDTLLRTAEVNDWDRAHNGLQVENDGRITRIAAAVDASLATAKLAIAARADLLLVHHGLFWSDTVPWTGKRRELQRLLLENNLAIYSSHLPLDLHPKLGNNAQLAAALGMKRLKPFFLAKGQHIGLRAERRISREQLSNRLAQATGVMPKVLPGGPAECRRIGIVTGGAGAELKQAAVEGVDTFITGEGPHWTFALAEELGVNVLYGGHYATETFGVKALAAHLATKYVLPWDFLDHPTGL
ncbi:MAG: Nif3-like dinuclear metal center hexameric protein [Verrucomicrobia bacterium]|nr:Nif3-like dinuclear metal center hexameric protein [Verrucomicrobiota bacterium]NBU08801.1 Nif3-like dinuclear metal center hexameric protein [Pseudomonadota bacterium]NDA65651.1 Nif3-like dinuclear metal center hexameric protein [Verrucomicrobiota bacterium]NDB74734.1 Nif3-like dinuclear metal center hexameric protein [Verrucomicrobiota bacterium]NDD37326.1 Nif3-like dinuclear metal center hexameric protein [Verrucomicrobiota bacterium]